MKIFYFVVVILICNHFQFMFSSFSQAPNKKLKIKLYLFYEIETITIFVNLGLSRHFETITNIRTWINITHVFENVVRCKYFEAGVHIENPIKNSYQDDLGRMTQTLDHVVGVHILI